MKTPICKSCREPFERFQTTQKACSVPCAQDLAQKALAKKRAKAARRDKAEYYANDKSYQLKLAQAAFNAFIRERDKALPCISSGRRTGQMHAGHYKSIGANPELRFDERNCNKQSMKDNAWLSGNILGYREGLIAKYGIGTLEWLDGPHEPKKYTLEDIIEIKQLYRAKLKELKA